MDIKFHAPEFEFSDTSRSFALSSKKTEDETCKSEVVWSNDYYWNSPACIQEGPSNFAVSCTPNMDAHKMHQGLSARFYENPEDCANDNNPAMFYTFLNGACYATWNLPGQNYGPNRPTTEENTEEMATQASIPFFPYYYTIKCNDDGSMTTTYYEDMNCGGRVITQFTAMREFRNYWGDNNYYPYGQCAQFTDDGNWYLNDFSYTVMCTPSHGK